MRDEVLAKDVDQNISTVRDTNSANHDVLAVKNVVFAVYPLIILFRNSYCADKFSCIKK